MPIRRICNVCLGLLTTLDYLYMVGRDHEQTTDAARDTVVNRKCNAETIIVRILTRNACPAGWSSLSSQYRTRAQYVTTSKTKQTPSIIIYMLWTLDIDIVIEYAEPELVKYGWTTIPLFVSA